MNTKDRMTRTRHLTPDQETNGTFVKSVAVLLPTFNEADNIAEILLELVAMLEQQSALETFHIVIVDDGSKDATRLVAEECWASLPYHPTKRFLHVVQHSFRGGYKQALSTGFQAIQTLAADTVIVMDIENSDDPMAIPPILRELRSHDIVFATRPLSREGFWGSALYQTFHATCRLFLGKKLYVTSFFAFSTRVLSYVVEFSELDYLSAKLSISSFSQTEIFIPKRARRVERSRLKIGDLVDYGVAALTTSSEIWTRLFSRVGVFMAVLSLVCILGVFVTKLLANSASSFNSAWACIAILVSISIGFQAVGLLVITAFLGRVLRDHLPTHANPVVTTSVVEARGSENHDHLRSVG